MPQSRRSDRRNSELESLFQFISVQAAADRTSIPLDPGEVNGVWTGSTWHLSLSLSPPTSLSNVAAAAAARPLSLPHSASEALGGRTDKRR